MKAAVIILWSEPWGGSGKTGGLITAGANLAEELGADCLYIPPTARRKKRPAHHVAYRFAPIEEVLDAKYDFVIFTSAGHFQDHKQRPSAIEHVLARLSDFPPFAVQVHDEVEVRQLVHRNAFFSSSQFRFALPITREIGNQMLPQVPRLVYPAYQKFIAQRSTSKARTIGMTGRMASRKNTLPFLKQAAPALIEEGWTVEIHGAEPNFFYARAVKEECARIGAKYCGPYAQAEDVLPGLAWHVNIPYLKNGSFIPRIEIATVEAAAAGCGLMTLAETTPLRVPTMRLQWGALGAGALEATQQDIGSEVNQRFVRWFNAENADLPGQLRAEVEKWAAV